MRKLITIALSFIMLMSSCLIVNANDYSDKLLNDDEYINDMFENLTGENFVQAYEYLADTDKNFANANYTQEEMDIMMLEALIMLHENNEYQDYDILPLGSDRFPNAYNRLNDKERELAKKSPYEAGIVYIASDNAVTCTGLNFKSCKDGTNANAYQHALWNFWMSNSLRSTDKAKKWADAHEYGCSGIETDMDYRNNYIGRSYFKKIKNANPNINSINYYVMGIDGLLDDPPQLSQTESYAEKQRFS